MIYNKQYWRGACCDYCGVKSKGKVFIKLIVPVKNDEMEYPYEEINMCEKCYNKIDIAFLINGIKREYNGN